VYRLLLCLAVTGIALCSARADDEPKSEKFSHKEGKFTVTVPKKPVEQKQKLKTEAGELDVYMFVVDQKDRGYITSYTDYPKGTVTNKNREKVLEGARDGSVKGVKGKLISDKKIKLGKMHDGYELQIQLPNKGVTIRSRIYLVGDRLYQVVALGPADFTKGKEVDAYFDSFKVNE
jgi:hypothetical protein